MPINKKKNIFLKNKFAKKKTQFFDLQKKTEYMW